MIAAPVATRPPRLWLRAGFAAAVMAAWLAAKPATEAGLPWIVCSAPGDPAAAARLRTAVKTLRSEALVTARGKHVTTQLVHLPPLAFSPRHVHGGDVTAYVLSGTVRSEHAGLPAAEFHSGDMFYEPYGTTHVFFENPSPTEAADVLAITVHEEGAALTTFLD